MILTKSQKEFIEERFAALNTSCISCGHTKFTILDKLFELREFHDGNILAGGDNAIIPAVVTVCNNCAEMRLFSALALGVIDNSVRKVNKNVK